MAKVTEISEMSAGSEERFLRCSVEITVGFQ
jgi:hypothetical protein